MADSSATPSLVTFTQKRIEEQLTQQLFTIALQCPYCRTDYDMDAIEQLLITNAQEKSMAFVLQDVVCSKCQGVKDTNMASYCRCAGQFVNTIKTETFREKVKTFQNIARYYKFEQLQEMIDWMMEMN